VVRLDRVEELPDIFNSHFIYAIQQSVVPTTSYLCSQAKRKKNTAVWSLRHAQTAAPATQLDCADVEFPNDPLSIQIGHNQWQKPNFHAFFVNIFMDYKSFAGSRL
jgi:hypothetical protein